MNAQDKYIKEEWMAVLKIEGIPFDQHQIKINDAASTPLAMLTLNVAPSEFP